MPVGQFVLGTKCLLTDGDIAIIKFQKLPLKNKFPFRRMKKDSGTAKHEENTAKEKVAKERESESESGIVTWCKGIVGIGLFITVIKNIISGVTDVMIKTTFYGMNPITLVFLRY